MASRPSLSDPAYRTLVLAPLSLAYTKTGGSTHVSLSTRATFCGSEVMSVFSSDAESVAEFDAQVTCGSCRRALRRRRAEQEEARAYEEGRSRPAALGPRHRLSGVGE